MDNSKTPDPLEELKCLAVGDTEEAHELQRIASAWQSERFDALAIFNELASSTNRLVASANGVAQFATALCAGYAKRPSLSDDDAKKEPTK